MSGCYCLVIAFRSMNSPQRSLVKNTLRYPLNLPLQKLFIVKWVAKVIYLICEMSQKKKLSMACQDKFVVPVMSITHHLRVITISLGFSLVCSAIHSWMLSSTLQPENPINIWIPETQFHCVDQPTRYSWSLTLWENIRGAQWKRGICVSNG